MSSHHTVDIQATLHAWREHGADRLDPVRFHVIEAMSRRAASHQGDARRVLDERLADLVKQYGVQVENAAGAEAGSGSGLASGLASASAPASRPGPAATASSPADAAAQGQLSPRTLAELLGYLAAGPVAEGDNAVSDGTASRRARYPELGLLDYFRATWSRVSTDRQLRQSQEQVHENAGPLNSNHLVHRALSLMRAQSPGYLHQFLAYIDALAWMEQMGAVGALPAKDAPRAAKPKKGPHDRAR